MECLDGSCTFHARTPLISPFTSFHQYHVPNPIPDNVLSLVCNPGAYVIPGRMITSDATVRRAAASEQVRT